MDLRDPSCIDDFDKESLTCDEALERVLQECHPISGSVCLAVRSTLGRILSDDLVSPIDVPPHTNSAMDGFALCWDDLPKTGTMRFKVIGTAFAGKPFTGTVGNRESVRIMTGAAIPSRTDTVIIQEHALAANGGIKIDVNHKRGQNVRTAGEDVERGQVVLESGHRLAPADLGLLASLGLGEVSVCRKIRVAYFSTGDELKSLGEPLGLGEIYDSNRYTLFGMLTRLGAEIIDMGVVRDTRQEVEAALEQASEMADVVITSGGVSVGEADYIKDTLEKIGRVGFWKVAMKPGRPLAFGSIGKARFFGLPGNPVSVMVTFYQFVQPALLKLAGARTEEYCLRITAQTTTALSKRPGRTEYQRGVLSHNGQGELLVSPTGDQGSGILRSMSVANCFIILPADTESVDADSPVTVQPFRGLV